MTWSLTGKANLFGIYAQDIVIPVPEVTVGQLVFFFIAETDIGDPFKSLSFRIQFPGEPYMDSPSLPLPPQFLEAPEGRTKMFARQAILTQNKVLRPGRILTTVIHEGGEIDAGGIWVVQQSSPQPQSPGTSN
jgi:hypothetical protein